MRVNKSFSKSRETRYYSQPYVYEMRREMSIDWIRSDIIAIRLQSSYKHVSKLF